MIERECKIAVPSLDAVAGRLRALGAVFDGGGLEDNRLFDTPDGALRARGVALRLRVVEGRPGGVVTVKGPPRDGTFKTREEAETRIDDPDACRRQWAMLGYAETFRYQKRRDEWRYRDTRIALDALPLLGMFVEVEGGEDAIRVVLAEIGLDAGRHIPDNYPSLWRAHCQRAGLPAGDMLFSRT